MSRHRDPDEIRDGERIEPVLGDLDQVDAEAGERPAPVVVVAPSRRPPPADRPAPARPGAAAHPAPRPAPPHRRRQHSLGWLWLGLAFALLAGGLWFNQNRLREMLPRTDFNAMLMQAQDALAAGHLDGEDGTSARELFAAALALEPDNDQARSGLRQVGQAELQQARAALDAGDLDRASARSALARELLGGGEDVDRLDLAIAKARTRGVQTVDVVDAARQALAAGRLAGPDGAGALYLRVLRADPGNAVAAHGLDQVGNALAVQARQALDANDPAGADRVIEQLAALQPANSSLPALRALRERLRKAAAADDALATELAAGQAALQAGRIAGDGADTALAHFRKAQELAPDDAGARAGLDRVVQALTVQANAALDAGDIEQAGHLLDEALPLAPHSPDLAALRRRVENRLGGDQADPVATAPAAVVAADAAATPPPAVVVADDVGNAGDAGDAGIATAPGGADLAPAPAASDRLAELVARADAAALRGDILMPPGASAYDLYRSALALNGNYEPARRGLARLATQVEQRFDAALAAGRLGQADDMLAMRAELRPGDAGQPALNAKLGAAWLLQGARALAAGDRSGAKHALERARQLMPGDPRTEDLAQRLAAGG